MNWAPTAGMRRAHDLVERIAGEAGVAESVITPLFRHRMVELIGREIDDAVGAAPGSGVAIDDDVKLAEADAEALALSTDEVRTGIKLGLVHHGVRSSHGNGVHKAPAAKPAQTARSRNRKAKGGKKGTLKLSGAAGRLAQKRIREAANEAALGELPVPIDGVERQ